MKLKFWLSVVCKCLLTFKLFSVYVLILMRTRVCVCVSRCCRPCRWSSVTCTVRRTWFWVEHTPTVDRVDSSSTHSSWSVAVATSKRPSSRWSTASLRCLLLSLVHMRGSTVRLSSQTYYLYNKQYVYCIYYMVYCPPWVQNYGRKR